MENLSHLGRTRLHFITHRWVWGSWFMKQQKKLFQFGAKGCVCNFSSPSLTYWGERCSSVGSILHGVDPLSYFSFQPVLHDWYNKGRGMYYPVCGMVHIKEPLLLIEKGSPCGGSGFHFSLSEWSLTICLTPYNRR